MVAWPGRARPPAHAHQYWYTSITRDTWRHARSHGATCTTWWFYPIAFWKNHDNVRSVNAHRAWLALARCYHVSPGQCYVTGVTRPHHYRCAGHVTREHLAAADTALLQAAGMFACFAVVRRLASGWGRVMAGKTINCLFCSTFCGGNWSRGGMLHGRGGISLSYVSRGF